MQPLQRAMKVHVLCLALIFLVISPSRWVFGQAGQEWGKPENGLQMSLFPASGLPASSTGFRFRLEIRNVGSNDLLIELGSMHDDGQIQYPSAVTALITNAKGQTLECGQRGPALPSELGGSYGPLIVPLPANASFVLPFDLEKWTENWKWCFAPSAYIHLNMLPGKYTFRIQYAAEIRKDHHFGPYGDPILPPIPGAPPSTIAIERAGQVLFPVWVGTATSNQLKFEWPPRAGRK